MIQAPQGDGRPCPTQVEQWKPCLVQPCFRWRYSSWSECRTEVSHQACFSLLFLRLPRLPLSCLKLRLRRVLDVFLLLFSLRNKS